MDHNDLFANSAKSDPRRSFLVVDLDMNGKRVSRNLVFFDVTHNLELPANPKIESNLTKAPDGYTLTLQSPALARSVNVSFGDLDVQVSDNYFDLLPTEAVTLTLKTSANLDELQKSMKVLSLTDAYASQGTHY